MSSRETGLALPATQPRSRELIAALATAAVLAQLLLFPLTLVIAIVLAATGRISRWRPHWLTAPAAAGLVLLLAGRASAALASYLAWPQSLAAYLSGSAGHRAGLTGLIASAAHGLPGQLPVALLAGTAEAAALAWLTGADESKYRLGLIAATRRRSAAAKLSVGRTVTVGGCAVGIETGTGRRTELSWAQAEQAVLICGPDDACIVETCAPVVCAALRRRKAVLIADLSGGWRPAAAAARLAGSLGVTIADVAGSGGDRVASGAAGSGWPGADRVASGAAGSGWPGADRVASGMAGPGADRAAAILATAIGQVLRRREAAIAPASTATVAGLVTVLAGMRDLRLRADALAWLHGCERADPAALAELIAAARDTGSSLLLSTASPAAAGELSGAVEVVIAAGPIGPELAAQLGRALDPGSSLPPARTRADGPDRRRPAAFRHRAPGRYEVVQALAALQSGTFAVLARDRMRPAMLHCESVPVLSVTPPRPAAR